VWRIFVAVFGLPNIKILSSEHTKVSLRGSVLLVARYEKFIKILTCCLVDS